MQDSLQSSGLREYVTGFTHHRCIFTLQKDFTPYGSSHQTKQDAVRGPQHAKKNSSQLEALLHSTKNSHTIRGPSSRQEELPHYSRPFFTPERLPVCTRPLIQEQSACKTPHVNTDIGKTKLTVKEKQHQPSSSSNCLCKHKHVAQSNSLF